MIYRPNALTVFIAFVLSVIINTGLVTNSFAQAKDVKQSQPAASTKIYGKVTETMNAAGYTYAEIDSGELKVWAATPNTAVKLGDMIAVTTEMPMTNHYSKSLKREFSLIYFVGRFITDKEETAISQTAHMSPHAKIKHQQFATPVEKISKVKDGYTISEIYQNKDRLKGKEVLVRGQVTKFTAKVMGKNWIHIQDSSTHQDLTVTTNDTAKLDDIVTLKGKLALDKDFNYGYVYPLIVENTKIIK